MYRQSDAAALPCPSYALSGLIDAVKRVSCLLDPEHAPTQRRSSESFHYTLSEGLEPAFEVHRRTHPPPH